MRHLLPVGLLLAVIALAAGCGSDSSDSDATVEWADGVCTAFTTWADSITAAADPLKSGDISKDSLQSAAEALGSATESLESDLKDLGKPDTDAGQDAKEAVDQLSSDLKTGAESIRSAADDVSSLGDIVGAASTVGTTLQTMQGQVTSAFTTLEQLDAKGELKDAFEQASACQQLGSS